MTPKLKAVPLGLRIIRRKRYHKRATFLGYRMSLWKMKSRKTEGLPYKNYIHGVLLTRPTLDSPLTYICNGKEQ